MAVLSGDMKDALALYSQKDVEIPRDLCRRTLLEVMDTKNCGQGLRLLIDSGAMEHILGPDIAQHIRGRQADSLVTYLDNVDKTLQIPIRRAALFFRCFNEKKAEAAIKSLAFSPEDEMHLLDGIYLMDRLYFLTNKYDFKKFLVKYGMDRYEFLHGLSKAHRIVYDLPVNRIESRDYVLKNIYEYNEPIFEEDLAVSREDFRQMGIGREKDYDRVFEGLLDLTHMMPKLNTREDLIKYGKKYAKHWWAPYLKKLKYIK